MEGKLIGTGRIECRRVQRFSRSRKAGVCCDGLASRDEIRGEVQRGAGLERINPISLEAADDAVPYPGLHVDPLAGSDWQFVSSADREMLLVVVRRDDLRQLRVARVQVLHRF